MHGGSNIWLNLFAARSRFDYSATDNIALTYRSPKIVLLPLMIAVLFGLIAALASTLFARPSIVQDTTGRNAALIVLIFCVPVAVRSLVVCFTSGLTPWATIRCLIGAGNDGFDFVLGRQGIAAVGLAYARALFWDDIVAIEIRQIRRRRLWGEPLPVQTLIILEARRGAFVETAERLPLASAFHLFGSSKISLNADLLGLAVEDVVMLIRHFVPSMPVRGSTAYIG